MASPITTDNMERPVSISTVPPDPLIDQVRETRAKLVQEHGGLRGWVAYLQEQQRKRLENARRPPTPSDR
jgi:hypothetical protein